MVKIPRIRKQCNARHCGLHITSPCSTRQSGSATEKLLLQPPQDPLFSAPTVLEILSLDTTMLWRKGEEHQLPVIFSKAKYTFDIKQGLATPAARACRCCTAGSCKERPRPSIPRLKTPMPRIANIPTLPTKCTGTQASISTTFHLLFSKYFNHLSFAFSKYILRIKCHISIKLEGGLLLFCRFLGGGVVRIHK